MENPPGDNQSIPPPSPGQFNESAAQPEVQPSGPPAVRPKKSSLAGFLVAGLLLVALAAGLFLYRSRTQVMPNTGESAEVIPSVTPAATGTTKANAVISPKTVNPVPSSAPKSEDEFYFQIGSAFKKVF